VNTAQVGKTIDYIEGRWGRKVDPKHSRAWIDVLMPLSEDQAQRVIDGLGKTDGYITPQSFERAFKASRPAHERPERQKPQCGTCAGNFWIEAGYLQDGVLRDFQGVDHANIVSQVKRCPDCVVRGIPAPVAKEPVVPMPAYVKAALTNAKIGAEHRGEVEVIEPDDDFF